VLLPVFAGTNCEYDMERAFLLAGAETDIFVFRNNTPQALSESLEEFARRISRAQILALSGGFSAGDEPDGSGKYIANVLREQGVRTAVLSLLKDREGLILGICNGFQALIKTGLVPYGDIVEPSAEMPTLTFNTIGRHISRVARTRLVSGLSPWAGDESVLAEVSHLVPISHGEGRLIVSHPEAERLFAAGQVFTRYVDERGEPAVAEPDNPNGSAFAIEGLTSPCGRALGKMGHCERTLEGISGDASASLLKNIPERPGESKRMNIFAAGVRYFL
jgi:phosphoribosylformylglycinamidine synthase